MQRYISIISLCFLAVLGGCAQPGTLSPLGSENDRATRPTLHAQFFDLWKHTTDNGEVRINMPDGEILVGEYSFLRTGKIGFGDLYRRTAVLGGANDPRTIYLSPMTDYIGNGTFGELSASGGAGTSMRCEFFYDARGRGQGLGVCKDSRSLLYSLNF